MTHKNDCTLIEDLSKQGQDAVPLLFRIIINNTMQQERAEHLKAKPHERTADCSSFVNGIKPITIKTKIGEITFDVPQVRDSDYYPPALGKGMRREKALIIALAEMYIQGVSARSAKNVT